MLYFFSEQSCLPLPKRLQIVLLNLDCHLVLLKLYHWVTQDFDGSHRSSVTSTISNSSHSGITAWEVFKSRSDLIFELANCILGEKSLLQVLGALVVVLLGFVN